MSKEYIISERDMSMILKANGWETLWSEDNWIKSNVQYSNKDMAGISTVRAFNFFKELPNSDEIITNHLKKLYGKI